MSKLSGNSWLSDVQMKKEHIWESQSTQIHKGQGGEWVMQEDHFICRFY